MPTIDQFIQVTTQIVTGGVARRFFGRGLILTTDPLMGAGGVSKVRLFNSISSIRDFFGATGDVVDAANIWFSASPAPEALHIGRWATTDVPTSLQGGTPAAISALAISNASFSLNGNDFAVNLSSPTTFAALASALQTAIAASITGTTVAYATGTNFTITLADATPITDGALQAHSAGTGVDISGLLGMAEDSAGRIYRLGHDQEAVADAVSEIVTMLSEKPTFIMRDNSTPDTLSSVNTNLALAAWAEAGDYYYGLRDRSAAAVTTNDSTSDLAVIGTLEYENTLGVYSGNDSHPEIGALAAFSAVDYNGLNTAITLMGKTFAGVVPSSVSDEQFAELQRKRANIYTSIAGAGTFIEGFAPKADVFSDSVVWLLWLKGELERASWGALRAAARLATPTLNDVLHRVMDRGVTNGGIQAGRSLNAVGIQDFTRVTGRQDFDGILPSGYHIHIGPPAAELETEGEGDVMQEASTDSGDAETRTGAPIKIYAIGSEAIHRQRIFIVFQN